MDMEMSDDDSEALLRASFALHDAAENGNLKLVEELLSTAAQDKDFHPERPEGPSEFDINDLDDNECSPLHIAILKGHVEVVELLLSKGADVELPCEGSPPLHIAVCSAAHTSARGKASDLVALLLRAGASTLGRDDNGRTGMHWAAVLGLVEIAKLLQTAHKKQTEEFLARLSAISGEVQMIPTAAPPSLLDAQDKQGNTALHLAASNSQVGVIQEVLLASDEGLATVTSTNKSKQTALHCACAQGSLNIVSLLLRKEPSMAQTRDKMQKSPADWASQFGYKELARYVENPASELLAAAQKAEESSLSQNQGRKTLILAPQACREHRTFPEPLSRETWSQIPPENVCRLRVLTDPEDGILRSEEFGNLRWDESNYFSPLADVLRVHDWPYVTTVQQACHALPNEPHAVGHLDSDTALSHGTFAAALASAGACCRAVDEIMTGKARNVFCAVRPPGHHAGPLGTVTSPLDPHGSQGFCFFNNIAIAAAYAVNVYRHRGVRRVALLDFDVHHGNGTEACMGRLIPATLSYGVKTPLAHGQLNFRTFKPWLDFDDKDNFLFASVQGYGSKGQGAMGHIYPGSGATCDTKQMAAGLREPAPQVAPEPAAGAIAPATPDAAGHEPAVPEETIPDDPDLEFKTTEGSHPSAQGPRIINVGIPGPGSEVSLWHRAWRDKILPAVADFKPDLIIVSAGFDAHKKDVLNQHYIGVTERDYYWLTQQIVGVANTVCQGRIVSALEGGYRIQGGIVSAFSRSVAAHVKALAENHNQVWKKEDAQEERRIELQLRRELALTRHMNAMKARQQAIERAAQQVAASAAAAAQQPDLAAQDQVGAAVGLNLDANMEAGQERKRRRKTVDYAALEEQLKKEEAAKVEPK